MKYLTTLRLNELRTYTSTIIMKGLKYLLLIALFSANSLNSVAQYSSDSPSGTLSPYSQFGLGALQEPQSGFNAGMNGLAIGMRGHNEINSANPASYSAIDSLTFIFDAGVSGQMTSFEQNDKILNRYTASIDYISAIFRVAKGVGVSFGLQPFSQIGYDYNETGYVGNDRTLKYYNTYHSRQTGIQNYYLGIGWSPFKYFSIGANIGYLHGEMDKNVTNSFSDSNIDTYIKKYQTNINSYKADFGLQTQIPLSKKDVITIGAAYSLGHSLNADQELLYMHTTSSTGAIDTVKYVAKDAFSIPHTISAGISYAHSNKWRFGADYSLQKWAELSYPVFKETSGNKSFVMSDNYYLDRQRITIGGEYCANEMSRKFLDRIRYRIGASYATPYYKIGNVDGPKELSVSAGFAIPIVNGYNNRSVLNISAQWVKAEASGLIKENTFRIKIGFTFNEQWFMKWKFN